jgi:hypothetical protein
MTIIASCNRCGTDYTTDGWAMLTYVGVQHCGDGGDCLELRNYPCKTTLGEWVECGCGAKRPGWFARLVDWARGLWG